jgi:DNA polymerase-3 subunit epsilon
MASALALTAFVMVGGAMLESTLADDQRAVWRLLKSERWPVLLIPGLALVAGVVAVSAWVYRRLVSAPAQLAEQARVLLTTHVVRDKPNPAWTPELRDLAQAIDALAAQREQLRADIAVEVARASQSIELERNRLAALMSELNQSVVVCNLDGRVLLYNTRARLQFRTLADADVLVGGADLIGLGRSIYTVFDRELVAHALESLQLRLLRGAAKPTAQFVTTTRSGQLLRAQMAPVLGADQVGTAASEPAAAPASAGITGFVLMLENITREVEDGSARERLLQSLTEGHRGSLASLQAAVEMLDDPDLAPDMRERFLAVVRDEVKVMTERMGAMAAEAALTLATHWPLEEMRATDFVQAAARRIEQAGVPAPGIADVAPDLWLKVDSYSLLQALRHLARCVSGVLPTPDLQLHLGLDPSGRARLDLSWKGGPIDRELVADWERQAVTAGGEAGALTVSDIAVRHGGDFWFERGRAAERDRFRFLLPLAPSAEAREALESSAVRSESRPEFYDFDLFAPSQAFHALDDRRLVELSFTVFDTETTGLDPAGGDEIIQIGAVRLVNGKLLRGERFEQLVDPRRSIPLASIPIHGITPEMVQGQPTIDRVLPAFHRYARDTVLVAHNAAFDMRFLQLKEGTTGLVFDQPVLDTLLLSAILHPHQDSHRLEAIAERFGVTVIGRHTAMGDAMVTAEVFQKLMPLLAERGIHTLGQARRAAQQSWYARLNY